MDEVESMWMEMVVFRIDLIKSWTDLLQQDDGTIDKALMSK